MWALGLALAWSGEPDVDRVFEEGLRVEAQQTAVLGAWAVANLGAGTVGAVTAEAPFHRAAWGTSAAWNTVNVALAGGGALSIAARRRRGPPSRDDLHRQQRGLRTALAVNLGLDAVYMGAGATLWAVGGEARGVDLAGVGAGLLAQGAFLAVFDAVYLTRHRRRTR